MGEELGRLKIEQVIYLAIMCELLEERFGETFVAMCQEVQSEIVLLCSDVPLHLALDCVAKKFDDPSSSLKQRLMESMQSHKSDM